MLGHKIRFALIISILLGVLQLHASELNLVAEYLEGEAVTDICEWKGKVWASTNTGLYRFENDEAIKVAVTANTNDRITSLYSGSPYALVCGTFQGDILFITQDKSNYCQAVWSMKEYIKNTSFYVNCVSQDKNGIWLGTLEKGVLLYNPETDSLTQFSLDYNEDTIGLNVYEFNTMQNGITWATAQDGLYFIMNVFGEEGELQYVKSNKLKSKPFDVIVKGNDTYIAYKSRGKNYLGQTKFGKYAFDFRIKDKAALPNDPIKAVAIEKSNDFWVLTDKLTHQLNNNSTEYYIKPSKSVGITTSDMIVLNDYIYISTLENGVLKYDKSLRQSEKEPKLDVASFNSASVAMNTKLELDLVFFAPGDTSLKTSSHQQLNELIALLKADETLKVTLTGHTARDGDESYLTRLSQGRSESVKSYLVGNDIAPSRIETIGQGAKELKVKNNPKSPKNRRVEIVLKH